MIDMILNEKDSEKEDDSVLLYYFCGADPGADQYTKAPEEASSTAILMTLLRQIVLAYHHSTAGLAKVLEAVSSSGKGMLSELGLRTQVTDLLESFGTVRCAYRLPLVGVLLALAYLVFEGSSSMP